MQLLLVLKAAAYSVLLALSTINWFWVFVFIAGAFYFYRRESLNAKYFAGSFLILVSVSLLALFNVFSQNSWLYVVSAIFFGILFFILLGVKNLIFVNRILPYYFLNSLLFGAVLILFFAGDKSSIFAFKYLTAGAAFFFLFREFIIFHFETPHSVGQSPVSAKKNLIALTLSFLILQFVWIAALLPIGFLNATSFMLLSVFILDDLLIHNSRGTLTRQIILRDTTFFLVITLIVFAFSKWTP